MKRKYLLTLALAVFYSVVVNSQAPPPPPPPPPGLPIDGGLILLFVAGIAYGVKKLRD